MKKIKIWLSSLALQLKLRKHTPADDQRYVNNYFKKIGRENEKSVHSWINDEHKNGTVYEQLFYEFATASKERHELGRKLKGWRSWFYSAASKKQIERQRMQLFTRMHEIQLEVEAQHAIDDSGLLDEIIN